jgi:oxygen-independent coproporphyrinogen-3 oxidase
MTLQSQLGRLGLFDARVPRYTSYPTAPQFSAEVGPEAFDNWVAGIDPARAISLYLHVPFCRRLCWFCACRTQGSASDGPVITYAETLRAEIAHFARRAPQGLRSQRIHWGGGTPTMLPPAEIRRLAELLQSVAPMVDGGEFSVEIDPGEIDEARLDALAEAGMNRASIGVQDFDPDIQKTIGRDQGYALTRATAEALRARGIRSLNADILYGLPHQTPERIARTVEQLISIRPDRVALYGYAHVPWMSRRQQMIPTEAIPAAPDRLALFEIARDLFRAHGYVDVGIDHFALPDDGLARASRSGTLRRNFQGYTDDPAPVLVGLGASAISRFPQGYAQNAPGTSDYAKAIRAGRFATHRGHAFVGEDLLRARIIEALMCDFAVRRDEILARFDVTATRLADLFAAAAERFGDVVRIDATGLAILPEGRPLARMIARCFDAYEMSKTAHSTAI